MSLGEDDKPFFAAQASGGELRETHTREREWESETKEKENSRGTGKKNNTAFLGHEPPLHSNIHEAPPSLIFL